MRINLNQLRSLMKVGRRRKMTKVRCRQEQSRPRQAIDINRKRIVWIVALLLLSVELPEVPSYISFLKPSILTDEKDWFIQRSFHLKLAEFWYYKRTCESLAWMLRMIAFTKTAVQYSTTVFLASLLIMIYFPFDLLMFWMNYNSWVYVYEFMILFIYFTGRSLVRPYRADSFARVKSLF